jgi:hypothetical protein
MHERDVISLAEGGGDMRWHGWIWVCGSWERVCQAEGLDGCGLLLAREARRRHVPSKYAVLTGGHPPGFVPRGEVTNGQACDQSEGDERSEVARGEAAAPAPAAPAAEAAPGKPQAGPGSAGQ